MGKDAAKWICIAGRAILKALPIWLFCLCSGPVELDRSVSEKVENGTTPGGGEEEIIVRKDRYVTGIEYPDGYDWYPDLGYSADGAVLFLMRNGTRILELPVGYEHHVSVDADMHRCVDGHLYTDFSTDEETIVKKDGIEMFRFFGREMIVSLIERPDGIYTLGQPRSGTGWVYRQNGEILLYKGSGKILHGLHMDGESICFSYQDVIFSGAESQSLYYLVVNGIPTAVRATDDVTGIDDIVRIDGTICYIASIETLAGRVLFRGPDPYALKMPSDATGITECRIILDDGEIFVSGNMSGVGSSGYGDSFWKGTELMDSASGYYKVYGSCIDGGKCYYVCREPYEGSTVRIRIDGRTTLMSPNYEFIYTNAIASDNGSCCVALNDTLHEYKPTLWTDGKYEDYDFNGAFTSISYW